MAITPKKVSVTGSTSLLDSKTFPSIVWTETKTAGNNVFTVDALTTTAVLTLTGAAATGSDTIKIAGYSGDFIASLSKTKLTLASNTQKISVTLAAASKLNLIFTDGTKVVDYTAKKLDGHVLTTTAWKIDGQTQFGADALKAALTDASGHSNANLTDAIAYAISTATGTKVTTLDALKLAYNPTFSVAAVGAAAAEGTDATFTVTLSAPQAVATSVNIALTGVGGAIGSVDGTTAGSDFNTTGTIPTGTGVSATKNVLTFAPGTTSVTLKFPILADSDSPENGEGIKLTLTDATGSIAKASATAATGTINITDVPKPPAFNGILEAGKTVAATDLADIFKLVAPTSDTEMTISGFNSSADKILVPVGSTTPSAVYGGVNNGAADTAVDLTWSNNGHVVTIHLTGVNTTTEGVMQANALSSVFGTY
jgi:hypothetical protein